MSLPTRVVRTSLVKTGLLFITGIAIVAALAGIPVEGGRILSLPWAIALVAMLTLICGMNALRPNKVTFTADYFEIQGVWGKPVRTLWLDIETIAIWRNPAPRSFQKLVAWRLYPDREAASNSSALTMAARSILRASGTLPPYLTVSIAELETLMRTYLDAARKHRADTPDQPAS